MIGIRTFVDEGLGHSSHLVELGDGTAAIVDPPRFPTAHLSEARAAGINPRWTIDTHSHADYVTGSPALAADRAITFVAPAASRLVTPHHGMHDDDRITLAPGVTLLAVATPGHTRDHQSYVLERGGSAVALFSGGSLMVGTVGRTDLDGPEVTEPMAREMFHSLRRFDHLPDELAVFPTHGNGSFCSASSGGDRTTTLGRERRTNELFRTRDEDDFVELLLAGFGSFPAYFRRLPEINRRGPRQYAEVPRLARLDVDTVERHLASGAVVVDVRPVAEFGAAHVPGSISNALRPVFASWLGWLVDLDRPIVVIAGDGQDRYDIMRQSLDIGHDLLVGELDGGVDAWRAAGGRITGTPLVDPGELIGTVIDVRQREEFAAGHVPGAINIELGMLAEADVPTGPLTVMCGHGERAMSGASILSARGHRDVSVLDGGPEAWAAWHSEALQHA